MGKNKKKDKKKVKQRKAIKRTGPTVDERAKQAMAIEPPNSNPYKLDNEKKIGLFLRYNRRKKERQNDKHTGRGRFKR
jgi:hypothetical protein